MNDTGITKIKLRPSDRIFLMLTAILASYQVAVGIDGFSTLPIVAYTIAFGVLLIASLLVFILGFSVLDSSIVVIVSTILPLSLATGLVWERLEAYRLTFLAFSLWGLLAIAITRSTPVPGKLPTLVLASVHAIAGLTIFLLPIVLAATRQAPPLFSLVGIGGGLIGSAGLMLSFLKVGRPIPPKETILKMLPAMLAAMTACYVAGFLFG